MSTIPSEYDPSRCLQTIAEIEADVTRLTTSLTECQFQAPPLAGGWSVAYCLEHLILTGTAALAEWDAALSAARRSEGPFRYSLMGRGMLAYLAPPYRIRSKTARLFVPCCRRSKDQTIRGFQEMHRQLADRIAASRGLDAIQTEVQSPFVSWIRYPLGLSFDLVLVHERRHLWQAWQVAQQFPGSTSC